MVDPILLGAIAGAAGLVAFAVRRQTQKNRQSLLAFARKRKGKVRTSDELGVVVEVRGIPVSIDFGLQGLRAKAPFALGSGPEGIARPGAFDSEYLASIGAKSDRAQRLANRLLRSYRWTGEHRALKPFVSTCAAELSSQALTIPLITTTRRSVMVEHRVLGEHADLEDLADGLAELAASIASWQMARVEEAAKHLRAPVVMRVREELVEPECTVDRVRFVFQLDGNPHPQSLVVRATIRCDPRVSIDGAIDRNGLRLAGIHGDAKQPVDDFAERIPPRARDLVPTLGTCTLRLRQRQDASLRWADASSADELAAGALFLQAVAATKDLGGAFR